MQRLLGQYGIQTRPNASPGHWLMFLLPLCLIVSTVSNPVVATPTYKLSAIFSTGLIVTSILFVLKSRKNELLRAVNVWMLASIVGTAFLFVVCLHRGIAFSLWSSVLSTLVYYNVYVFLLRTFPRSFTLGEAAICSQSIILLLYFAVINIFECIIGGKVLVNNMQIATIIIQIGLLGLMNIIFCCHIFHVSKVTAFAIVTVINLAIILVTLQVLIKQNPVVWIINFIVQDTFTIKFLMLSSLSSALAVLAINRQIANARKASTSVRKIFHILSIAVFIPGILYSCSFLYLASGVALGIFLALDTVRNLNVSFLAPYLDRGFVVFSDDKDAGAIALTPMYLLAGCSLPLWIHPAPCDVTNSATFHLLPLLSGVLSIGVGDTVASVVGSAYGKYRWRGSEKTIEGTVACILSQLAVVYILINLGFVKVFSPLDYAKITTAVVATSIVEAKTDQVDNIVLPLAMYLLLIF